MFLSCIVCGLLGATVVARMIGDRLQGVQPFDISTLVATYALMVVVGRWATWWPARRAATIWVSPRPYNSKTGW